MNAPKILLVCAEPDRRARITEVLQNSYTVEAALNEQALLNRIAPEGPDLVLLDMGPEFANSLDLLERCKMAQPQLRIVILSVCSETSQIVQAIKRGAEDFISPLDYFRLKAVLTRLLGVSNPSEPVLSSGDLDELDDDRFFVSAGAAMKQIRKQVDLVARVDVPVLVLGESGVGKEMVARLIHKLSPRSQGPLVKVNCAALPTELLESEMFGYEAGAFTGALKCKLGKFELADGGTLLLDEIGEMSPQLQAKLLHVLQDGRYSRLGGRKDLSANVRILAATNINIQAGIAARKFREDLYYRLNAFTITIPPLCERREEIPLLLAHFMTMEAAKMGKSPLPISKKLLETCVRHDWPGNLRELVNIVQRYLVLEDEDIIMEDLHFQISKPVPKHRTNRTKGGAQTCAS